MNFKNNIYSNKLKIQCPQFSNSLILRKTPTTYWSLLHPYCLSSLKLNIIPKVSFSLSDSDKLLTLDEFFRLLAKQPNVLEIELYLYSHVPLFWEMYMNANRKQKELPFLALFRYFTK